jgi:glycerophosphoryl diester phosphodiesterase
MDAFLHDITWVLPFRSETATLIFNGFTFLGYTPFFLIMLPLGYWLADKAMFTRLAMLIGLVAVTNSFLKDLFQDPRPPLDLAIDGRVGDSFGFPSGHAQIAVAMWLWLAYEIKRGWAWALAIVIAAGVCFSRLYLGVHDVEDVLGGALLGLACIVIFKGFAEDPAWANAGAIAHLLPVAAIVPLLMFAWPREPVAPQLYGLVAFLAGWLIGNEVERRLVGYQRHPNWLIAILAAAVALALVFGLMRVMGALTPGLDPRLAQVLQFGLVAFFVTAIAPAAFRAARLGRP